VKIEECCFCSSAKVMVLQSGANLLARTGQLMLRGWILEMLPRFECVLWELFAEPYFWESTG
jgi:hypothetical protein